MEGHAVLLLGSRRQERQEQKRQEKLFHYAMQHSPIGGLIEATFAAEEGESEVLLDYNLSDVSHGLSQWRARIEILKAEIHITSGIPR